MLSLSFYWLYIEAVHIFPPYIRHMDFTFTIIDVGEKIFSGHTIKVTVYTNVQLILPLFDHIRQNTVTSDEHTPS
jgi:hypothetical protein